MAPTRVKDVMTTPVVTVGETAPFRQVVALLYARGISAAPVLDPDGRVRGVVSNADLACKAVSSLAVAGPLLKGPRRRRDRRKARARTAGEAMTAPAVTITPEASIGQAAHTMHRNGVGRLPVTHPLTGRLAGIVTRSDLLHVYLRPDKDIRAEIEKEVLSRAGGADSSQLAAAVCGGIATLSGRVERRSAISGLMTAIQRIDGVVGVDNRLHYIIDDSYPIAPVCW